MRHARLCTIKCTKNRHSWSYRCKFIIDKFVKKKNIYSFQFQASLRVNQNSYSKIDEFTTFSAVTCGECVLRLLDCNRIEWTPLERLQAMQSHWFRWKRWRWRQKSDIQNMGDNSRPKTHKENAKFLRWTDVKWKNNRRIKYRHSFCQQRHTAVFVVCLRWPINCLSSKIVAFFASHRHTQTGATHTHTLAIAAACQKLK